MGMFFLTKLGVSGIKNIETPIEFSFYKKTINNDFDPTKYRVKAIYGENGSGKTAVITAVKLLKMIVEEKDYLRDTNTQRVLADLVNKKTKRGHISVEFYADYGIQELSYRYSVGFEIKDDSRFYLKSEKLEYKKGTYSKKTYATEYEVADGRLISFEGNGERYNLFRERTLNLLDQQSFVSTVISNELISDEELFDGDYIHPIIGMLLFSMSVRVWIDDSDNHSSYLAQKEFAALLHEEKDSEEIRKWIELNEKAMVLRGEEVMVYKHLIKPFERKVNNLCSFIRIFKPDLKKIKIEKKDYNEYYKCNLVMVYDKYSLDREFESRGIKKLMDLFDVLNVAAIGGIAFIDELDSNISDVYLDKLIEYITLLGDGQLCFTAHNLSPMSIIKDNKNAIDFISSVNSVHTWTKRGNLTPENAYKKGFIEDSPFNVDSTDFVVAFGKVRD